MGDCLLSVSFKDAEEMEAVERRLKIRFADVRQRGTHVAAFFAFGEGIRRSALLARGLVRAEVACRDAGRA